VPPVAAIATGAYATVTSPEWNDDAVIATGVG
jgi:hypothetical protein